MGLENLKKMDHRNGEGIHSVSRSHIDRKIPKWNAEGG